MLRILVPLLLTPLLAGCIYSSEVAHLRRDVERATGAEFEREFVAVLGPTLFRTLGWMARRTPDVRSRLLGDYISDIEAVKVGVYRVREAPDNRTLRMSALPRLYDGGWEKAVRVEQDSETAWVLYRARYGAIRDVLVLVLDDENLVIVRLRGQLGLTVSRAVFDRDLIRDIADLERRRSQ